ncbi:uncharacterized protein LOC130635699 [Hydractinia symbiolongicarpus]|uniref:uncharacterized protein LOC130635699 n=1 Tax=Hydractinia symbiolongicarpus TaxID=13093 RepID=UPI00254F3298|nr:uncharacterized protein LOC130635699 [Hydractinia symbiolongicarpus]XP_057301106.1 uncharacterized protein LOC130635699 [Hydractinia symbiolongicarpus]XP_057301107.1 uncharacterized protein LOC130635699 [Hydractinia symbiolongicarpus]XP_057301108.1 uncharacterized protein LOC130635699 [Hydractinia symbiolongicarpus]XP_057301110.1 uncharacterized protein LOC130635699 [Hydractinia symbiolongicarpus]
MFRQAQQNRVKLQTVFKRLASFVPVEFNTSLKQYGSRIRGRKFLVGSSHKEMPEFLSYTHNPNLKAVRFEGDKSKVATAVREYIDANLQSSSAILFKGLPIESEHDFNRIITATDYKMLPYVGGVASRDSLVENVYEASNEPKEMSIDLHNEMSCLKRFPQKIMFCCITPPTIDGETPICFNREFLPELDPRFVKKADEKKIRYIRNYAREHSDYMSWQSIFKTNSKERAEEVLKSSNSEWKWHSDGTLTSWHICDAFITHPETKEKIWFNQIAAMHNSFYFNHPDFYDQPELKAEEIPHHVSYGDGEEVELEYIQQHRIAQWKLAVGIQWEKGDLLVLDNLLAQHGRMSYEGARKLAVSLIID